MEAFIVFVIIVFLFWIFSRRGKKSEYKTNSQSVYPSTIQNYSTNTQKNTKNLKDVFLEYANLAKENLYEENFDLAISYYDKAIEINPSEPFCFNNRAHCKSQIKDYQGAIEDYSKAIKLNSNKAIYFANRGMTFWLWGKKAEAINDWKIAAELGSNDSIKLLNQLKINYYLTDDSGKNRLLDKYKINYLYHMTHRDNLKNILSKGLLSHNYAYSSGLTKVNIADSAVNIRRTRNEPVYNRSIHDYVPLYFNPKNPMLFRRRNIQDEIIILCIDKRLIYHKNSLFSDGNAASNPTCFYNDINDLDKLNWNCINADYWNDFNDGKRIRCAEVLVYKKINLESIKKILCNNNNTLNFVKQQIRDSEYQDIIVEIDLDMFF